ncbi:ABC transporter substrate-binding protein [Flexibacterium corallicola]|uniref:ABC transporter substrate-binding protein n=1 Tax=Flexibacterium corallicola TaxID=3037259 RepID=UPI00286F15C9|nr:ABC transporter substrate-binding protein [Pseudovibrio sp. M1P-2-3]
MIVWRGCETACRGFIRYFDVRRLPVNVTVTDVARDKTKLPEIKARLQEEKPDLVVTWGTTVTRSILGTISDYGTQTALGDIPSLFMIVADPVRSDIIENYNTTGRPWLTGVHNRIKEEVQLKQIFEYYHPNLLAVINSPSELNSRQNTQKLAALSKSMGFELLSLDYEMGDDEKPVASSISDRIAQAKAMGADAIYVGSSSYNLENRREFTAAALEHKLPVFSAYEQMVRDGMALMSVSNSYANVGKLAASQADQILLGKQMPGSLPVKALDRFSIFINMKAAKQLDLYPPLPLALVAEVVQ